MIVVIDNYDSFTYNLVQYLGELQAELNICRNDEIDIEKVRQRQPDGIVISPGPGRPENAGISVPLVRELAPLTPILGVCLGHQAIGLAFGGVISRTQNLMHGKTSKIFHGNRELFNDIPNPFEATRYHSLIVERNRLPSCLRVTAETEDKVIMGLQHETYSVYGVQFHPESILTHEGKRLLKNFLAICNHRIKERSV
ncbi:aminodeoxychorismate/anthranilate synthase component II [candidate division KSB1 bacterium]|nr:aminodeoxychorismate/anthranilate synthase component II [candidate division KSB1 bacterium]NIR68948.1 aminodeoxychorismate/anthranilate synthase component II [candidate division KSB1 bacterium]NIS27285.1 aminodeoxychorismate/anthranilate synthase component II [candidate division KSB1 bacterium]NIT74164.1 aminodeoxychorismate/anthranilate synthase component II [candidate division KSB1 bacterium]NIU28015.1 aminodeoxychorismate/anthranilate synthase component II [candidate division KSB1 bacteri